MLCVCVCVFHDYVIKFVLMTINLIIYVVVKDAFWHSASIQSIQQRQCNSTLKVLRFFLLLCYCHYLTSCSCYLLLYHSFLPSQCCCLPSHHDFLVSHYYFLFSLIVSCFHIILFLI